ncbi:VWA domain-containing protein [Telmatobacter sp. DSM 110680]|uniref:VWA domain-containing protein n=1 Tax=Telmatobacter sp. DSM 110680 TaxID=3036704 RepID=A0AAU7DEF1_9BACT
MSVEAKMWPFIQYVATLAIVCIVAAAQTPTLKTRTREDREREFQASHRIVLNVQVTDAAGKPVTDLDAKDFAIFDNHEPRKLVAFHAIDGEAMNDATEVIILLDAVNSTTQALEAEKAGIFKYFAQSHSALPYPTSFVLWSNGHLKATGATKDRNAVGKAFVSMTKNLHSNACAPVDGSAAKAAEAAGTPGQNEVGPHAADVANCLQVHFKDSLAALDGIAEQQRHVGGRTIFVWVGAGWPLPSDIDFAQLSPKARKSYSDELVNILNDLRASQVTLDALGVHDPNLSAELTRVDQQTLPAGAASPLSAGPSSLGLPILARQTGGRVMSNSNDISADLGKLFDDADWYYALSFNPPPASNGVELRSLEVKISRPGLNIRTMTGYYTEPF